MSEAQDAMALIERLGITVKNLLDAGYTNAAINVQDAIEALRSTPSASAGPQAEVVVWRWCDLADYLDRLEEQMIGADADMAVDEKTPPSVWADRIRAAHPQPQQADGGGEVIEAFEAGALAVIAILITWNHFI